MPLYIGDYLADTQHLTAQEHGAYLLLLMHYWQCGKLSADDHQLMRIARVHPPHWPTVKSRLIGFFDITKTPGLWLHHRVESELTKTAELSNKRKAAALHKHSKCSANAVQLHTQSQSQSQSKKEYAFESGIIRLTEKDFNQWKSAFSHLDLAAELLGLSKWASEQGLNWFPALSGALAKRNREAKARLTEKPKFKTLSGMEGIL